MRSPHLSLVHFAYLFQTATFIMPLPETMRAAVLEELGKPLVFKDVPVPKPERGEIIVKLETCGVCHSDLHLQDGDWLLKPTPPVILGHEG